MNVYVDIGASFFRHPVNYIEDPNWVVHLIEPIPKYHEGNVNRYKDNPTVFCHNVAIDTSTGRKDFKIIDEDKCSNLGIFVTDAMRGTVGFDPVNIKDTKRNEFIKSNKDKIYKTIKVDCVTFDEFAYINNISEVNFLKTDTEGFDIKILESIDLNKYKVKNLKFEYVWSHQRTPKQYNRFIDHINELGFKQKNKDWADEIYTR